MRALEPEGAVRSLWQPGPKRGQCGKAAALALAISIPVCLALAAAVLLGFL